MVVQGLEIEVVRKRIRNVYIRIYSPDGRLCVTAPVSMSEESIRSFVFKRIAWIQRKLELIREQKREVPHRYINGEIHTVWGQECRLVVVANSSRSPMVSVVWPDNSLVDEIINRFGSSSGVECGRQGSVLQRERELCKQLGQGLLILQVPSGEQENRACCEGILAAWYREQVHSEAAAHIANWEPVIQVPVEKVFVRRMKTKWGSCNVRACTIRLNTELAKYTPECLEYVTVHEMVHILEPSHGPRFVAFMNQFMPDWKRIKKELNRHSLVPGHNEGGQDE